MLSLSSAHNTWAELIQIVRYFRVKKEELVLFLLSPIQNLPLFYYYEIYFSEVSCKCIKKTVESKKYNLLSFVLFLMINLLIVISDDWSWLCLPDSSAFDHCSIFFHLIMQ